MLHIQRDFFYFRGIVVCLRLLTENDFVQISSLSSVYSIYVVSQNNQLKNNPFQ